MPPGNQPPPNPQPGPQGALPAIPAGPTPVYLTPPPAALPPLPVTIVGATGGLSPVLPPLPSGGAGGSTSATGILPATPAGRPFPDFAPPPLPGIPDLVLPSVRTGQALQTAGAGVGGGTGQLLGDVGALAAGGPAGALVAAAKGIYDQVEGSLKAAVSGIGESLQKVAALNPRGFLDPINALTERVPLVGAAMAEVNRQFVAFTDALTATAQRLGQYSPEIAVASAQADVAQILGDVRRAQQLGSGLSRFTAAQSQLSQTAQDVMADILQQILPIVTNILEFLNEVIRRLRELPADIYDAFVDAVNLIVTGINTVVRGITFGNGQQIPLLQHIVRNTQPKDDETAVNTFLNELLGVAVPAGNFVPPPRAPGFVGG